MSNCTTTTETCATDCGSYACSICGPALRAAVAHAQSRPVEAARVAEAEAEIGETYFGGDGVAVDRELVSQAVMAVAEGKGQFAGHGDIAELLRSGVTFVQAANQLGLPVAQVVQKFTQVGQDRVDAVLQAERLLRSGCDSYGDVAAATGLTRQQALWLGRNLGCESGATAKRKAGGGTKYTAEQVAQAWALRDGGASYRQIAEAMPEVLKDTNAAVGILRRNARPADSAREDGTVEA